MKMTTNSTDKPRFHVFFGGPDRQPRSLRDQLESRIAAVPASGEILWATYYFRDRALADELVRARKRGVRVRLTLEAHPRTSQANRPVLDMLRQNANLGSDCRPLRHYCPDSLCLWRVPRLHTKLYYFSHPEPHVLVGSFNPSGNQPEDREIIAKIGDQDHGHNHLVEIVDPRLVDPLRDHLLRMHAGTHGPWERFLAANNREISTEDTSIFLFPRWRRDIIRRKLLTLPAGTKLRIAASHLNDPGIVMALSFLRRRGVVLEMLSHDTKRRVPRWAERLLGRQLMFRRYHHPQGFPMHNKFILIDTPLKREVMFGSMNLSNSSLHANHELLVLSSSASLYEAFHLRWHQMLNETEAIQA